MGYKGKEEIRKDPKILVSTIMWVVMLFTKMGMTEQGTGLGIKHSILVVLNLCIRYLNDHCIWAIGLTNLELWRDEC